MPRKPTVHDHKRRQINRRSAFPDHKPVTKPRIAAIGSPPNNPELAKTARKHGYKYNAKTKIFEHTSGSRLHLKGNSWQHYGNKNRKTKNGRGSNSLHTHLTNYHKKPRKTNKPRKPAARSRRQQSLFQRLYHHIFANLDNKAKAHIKKIMAPMSHFRQNLATKLADTPKIIKKAFPTEAKKHKAAQSLRQILQESSGSDKKHKLLKRILSPEHKQTLYRILKAAGIAAVQTAAIASGTPLIYLATPELARHVYEHWTREGQRSYRGDHGPTSEELPPGNQQQNQQQTRGPEKPEAGKPDTALYSKYVQQMSQLGYKPLPYLMWKQQWRTQATTIKKQAPLVPQGKFMVDWRKLNDDQLLSKFISLLRAHLRTGNFPKQSIENSLRLHPREFSGSKLTAKS